MGDVSEKSFQWVVEAAIEALGAPLPDVPLVHPFNRTMRWKLGKIALQVGVDTGWTFNY